MLSWKIENAEYGRQVDVVAYDVSIAVFLLNEM